MRRKMPSSACAYRWRRPQVLASATLFLDSYHTLLERACAGEQQLLGMCFGRQCLRPGRRGTDDERVSSLTVVAVRGSQHLCRRSRPGQQRRPDAGWRMRFSSAHRSSQSPFRNAEIKPDSRQRADGLNSVHVRRNVSLGNEKKLVVPVTSTAPRSAANLHTLGVRCRKISDLQSSQAS